MRLRHKKNAEVDVYKSIYCINNNGFFDAETNFKNNNKLQLELGMGKGKFVIEMSKNNLNINYIGIERSATIVLKAIENYKSFLNAELNNQNSQLSNLKFMCMDIGKIDTIFPKQKIDKIYINFCDPWPKKRHAIRRLTHINFLNKYYNILDENRFIEFKTDNVDLFDFTLEEIKKTKFEIVNYTYDLANDDNLNKDNIMTEYEEKFTKKGNKICKVVIRKI